MEGEENLLVVFVERVATSSDSRADQAPIALGSSCPATRGEKEIADLIRSDVRHLRHNIGDSKLELLQNVGRVDRRDLDGSSMAPRMSFRAVLLEDIVDGIQVSDYLFLSERGLEVAPLSMENFVLLEDELDKFELP